MITRLTNFALRGYQGFAIDKSLIKKIYSQRKPIESAVSNRGESAYQKATSFSGEDNNQFKLKEAIKDRAVFRYGYRKGCRRKLCDQIYWFFCQCWCQPCCPRRSRKLNKEERLFGVGIKKLYTEIDLLEIIKQLRIGRFMSSLYLGQSQRELVKFLKIYSLNRPKRSRRAQSRALQS